MIFTKEEADNLFAEVYLKLIGYNLLQKTDEFFSHKDVNLHQFFTGGSFYVKRKKEPLIHLYRYYLEYSTKHGSTLSTKSK